MHYQTKQMLKESLCNLSSLVYNLLYFANRSQNDNDIAMLRNLVLSLPNEVKNKYAQECSYVESLTPDDLKEMMFPYPIDRSKSNPVATFSGTEHGLPFVMHGENSKLFFRRCESNALRAYDRLVHKEGLLGTGNRIKSPHSYQDNDFKVNEGEVLLDIGCSEAIFALDNINKVSKAYLFESSPEWRKPLRYTFAPYADKVVIVNKLVANKTQGKSTTLIDAIKNDMISDAHFFVKMDIEGCERAVIKGNAEFFSSAKVKLSCCVYHRQDDAQVIETMLKKMGYKTRFSNGYLLLPMNGVHYPYFRHGLIYAQNY